MDGLATLTLLPHGEDYVVSMPYAHCKGLCLLNCTPICKHAYIASVCVGKSRNLIGQSWVQVFLLIAFCTAVECYEFFDAVYKTSTATTTTRSGIERR